MGFVGPERGGVLQDLGVKLTDRGNVWRDDRWMTSVPGVFTAGDMQRGQSLVVWAIADGRHAAVAVVRIAERAFVPRRRVLDVAQDAEAAECICLGAQRAIRLPVFPAP